MATSTEINAKTIDDLRELAKLTGLEKTIVSFEEDTRKVSIDTIIGYAASILANNSTPMLMSVSKPATASYAGQCLVVVPEGEEIPITERATGCFYLEKVKQSSIRTKVNVPTSVTVSSTLGLRRV